MQHHSSGHAPGRLLTIAVALSIALVAIAGSAVGTVAQPSHDKKAFEAFMGDIAEPLADCIGTPGARACVKEIITQGSYIAGFSFSIGAIMKFKAHKGDPTGVSGAFIDCLGAAADPGDCVDATYGNQLGGPSMKGLALAIAVYDVMRDHCEPAAIVCTTPDSWPVGWPWTV